MRRWRRWLLAFACIWAPLSAMAQGGGWTASHQFPPGDPRDMAMRLIASEMAQSGVSIRIFPGASLLRPGDQMAALMAGSVDLVFIPADYLVERVPLVAALSLPGLIRTQDQALRVGASAPMRELKRQLEAAGIMVLAETWMAGVTGGRHKCIQSPADAKRLRTRTIGPFMADMWSAAGAVPVSALTSDTLTSLLDNDLIDVANTSALTMLTLKPRRKIACLTVPGPAGAFWYLYEPILISKKRYDSLDDQVKAALLAAAQKVQDHLNATHSMNERRLMGDFAAGGTEVVTMDADNLAAWHKLARRTAWKLFRDQVPGGADFLDKLQAID
jgi:TRAP-type C4-dicarboxylate transport system substrate-binding protein